LVAKVGGWAWQFGEYIIKENVVMFFVLSKTLNYFTQPLMVVLVLFIISYLLKNNKWKRRIRYVAIGLALLFTNPFIANEVIGLYETPVTPLAEIKKQYEWGIVLTGVTSTNKELKDRVYVGSSPDRVNHSFLLYKRKVIKKILISGGSGRLLEPGESEADDLYSMYVMMGVDSADLRIEGESRNTYESAVAVAEMMKEVTTPENCLLITSGYHMPRSKACFKKAGWDCDAFATDILYHKREFTPDALFLPRTEAIGLWTAIIKEWVGMTAYWVSGYV
jgi:uncharacterized SAM-binding protein YcdF (DUF218 family)